MPVDGEPHSIDVPQFGEYRAIATSQPEWGDVAVVLALPLAEVNAATTQLALTISIVAIVGLMLALVIGSAVVRRALARWPRSPPPRSACPSCTSTAATSRSPSACPSTTTAPRSAASARAFNRMLGHVGLRAVGERAERAEGAPLRRRREPRAAHAARLDPRLRRAHPLHGGELPPDVMHAIGRIESESVRMTELVEDLLLLARLDEGRELASRPVDLDRVVVEAVGDAQAAGPGHDWEVRLPDAPTVVTGDEPRLRQVVTNLLANARVHTPDGTSVVAVLERDGDDVVLAVEDDGPGIPPALLGTLFERFARGDSSRSRRAGSTGLGLAIVRAVVEAHHGDVLGDERARRHPVHRAAARDRRRPGSRRFGEGRGKRRGARLPPTGRRSCWGAGRRGRGGAVSRRTLSPRRAGRPRT